MPVKSKLRLVTPAIKTEQLRLPNTVSKGNQCPPLSTQPSCSNVATWLAPHRMPS